MNTVTFKTKTLTHSLTHSLTAVLDQLRVVASSTSNDPGPRSGQHQQIGQCLLPLVAANFSMDDPAGASSQRREKCWCGLLLTVAVPANQVCSLVGDRCDQIMNDANILKILETKIMSRDFPSLGQNLSPFVARHYENNIIYTTADTDTELVYDVYRACPC